MLFKIWSKKSMLFSIKRSSINDYDPLRPPNNSGKVHEPVEAGVRTRKVVDVAPLLDRERLGTVAAWKKQKQSF